MARYVHKLIPVSALSATALYCLRSGLGNEALLASIKKRGVLQPLIVTPGLDVISGHRRLAVVRELSLKQIEVLELASEPSPQEAFLMSILSNWHQPFSELERANIISAAKRKFQFQDSEIFEEIFPALKMNPDKGIYEEALEITALAPELLDLVAADKMPFRGARILASFSPEDQRAFAIIAREAAFTTNQLLKAGEWLFDLLKMKRVSLAAFLKENSFEELFKSELPRNQKGEKVFVKIRTLRFPQVSERERQFSGLSEQLRDEKSGLSVEMPPFLEGEGFTLKARLKSRDSLEAVLGALQSKRKVLNSLLDIVL